MSSPGVNLRVFVYTINSSLHRLRGVCSAVHRNGVHRHVESQPSAEDIIEILSLNTTDARCNVTHDVRGFHEMLAFQLGCVVIYAAKCSCFKLTVCLDSAADLFSALAPRPTLVLRLWAPVAYSPAVAVSFGAVLVALALALGNYALLLIFYSSQDTYLRWIRFRSPEKLAC